MITFNLIWQSCLFTHSAYICGCVCVHLMNVSVTFTLLLALFGSLPAPEGIIWFSSSYMLHC